MAVLTVDRLCVEVRGVRLVDEVSFEIGADERVGLLGRSGSGKSSTAAAIVGHRAPEVRLSGRVVIDGAEVLEIPAARRPAQARAAMVFQDSATSLHPSVTVGRQVREIAPNGVAELLRSVGFDDPDAVAGRYPGDLSGGQRQRVCLALALAGRRSVMVADEPTTALDVRTQALVADTLRHARAATLFITHDLAVAASICDRLIVMDRGRVVEAGATQDLLAAPRSPITAALVEAAMTVTAAAGSWR